MEEKVYSAVRKICEEIPSPRKKSHVIGSNLGNGLLPGASAVRVVAKISRAPTMSIPTDTTVFTLTFFSSHYA